MALQLPNFDRISFQEANPALTGMKAGQDLMQNFMSFPQDLQTKILANQIAQVQAKYADPMAQANLKALQQQNQYNPQIWQSEIGLRGAESGLYGSETQQNLLKLNLMKSLMNQQGGIPSDSGANTPAGGGSNAAIFADNANAAQSGAGAGSAQQASQQPAATNQPPAQSQVNSTYGIPNPQLTKQDLANQMLFGVDTYGPKKANAQAQQQDQYTQFQTSLSQAIQQANSAVATRQLVDSFNQAMKKSFYKGPALGELPSKGLSTVFIPGNLSNEQTADRIATQLLPQQVSQLRNAMDSSRFSNLDMQVAEHLNFDRTMSDETRNFQSQWLNGVQDRSQERAKFLSTMSNPQMGVTKSQAEMLWQNYQNDFPLVSKDGKTYMGSNLGNWPLYVTPKAIASVKETGMYTPSAAEKNTYMMYVPTKDGRYVLAPIKKGQVEAAFRKGAKPV